MGILRAMWWLGACLDYEVSKESLKTIRAILLFELGFCGSGSWG